MRHCQIIVLKHKGHWVIRSQKVAKETMHENREAALKAAIDLAYQSGKNGDPAKVMLCDIKNAEAQVFWTYGKDAYPPSLDNKAAAALG